MTKRSFYFALCVLFICTLTGCREKAPLKSNHYRYCGYCDGYGYTGLFRTTPCRLCFSTGQIFDFSKRGTTIVETGPEVGTDDESSETRTDGRDVPHNGLNVYPPIEGPSVDPPIEEPVVTSQPCLACHQTGQCVCARDGHPGQTLSALSIGRDEPVYMRHSYCDGTGICPACGGDGMIP